MIRACVRVPHMTRSFEPLVARYTYNMDSGDVYYPPPNSAERAAFRTEDGKKVSDHAWAVYDYIRGIPVGKVTTYKVQSESFAHPRSCHCLWLLCIFPFHAGDFGCSGARLASHWCVSPHLNIRDSEGQYHCYLQLNHTFLFAFI